MKLPNCIVEEEATKCLRSVRSRKQYRPGVETDFRGDFREDFREDLQEDFQEDFQTKITQSAILRCLPPVHTEEWT